VTATGTFSVTDAGIFLEVSLTPLATGTHITGDFEIDHGGTYVIDRGVSDATITVSTTDEVTVAGSGIGPADVHEELEITYSVEGGTLNISDLYVHNGVGATSSNQTGKGRHIVDFKGGENSLTITGKSLFDHDGYIEAAGIHVPSLSTLVMSAPGTLYMYKRSQGSGIGGDSYEASGNITFTGGHLFLKGSKTGALIGGDAGAAGITKPGSTGTNGDITFSGGEVVLVAKAQGAAIGSSHLGTCAGDVYLTGANLTVILDWNAGIGHGGGAPQDAPSGRLYVTGGSLKVSRTANSYFGIGDDPTRAINGSSVPAYTDDALVDAEMLGSEGTAVELLVFDTTLLTESTGDFTVYADGTSVPFYTGGLHGYRYTESMVSTPANFGIDTTDTCLYLYLTPEDHTLRVDDTAFDVSWDADASTFIVTPVDTAPDVGAPGSGDLDGDGSVTAAEALTVARYAIGTNTDLTPAQILAADMDGDGFLTIADALAIMRVAVGL
jgi:hypothetical protein